MIDIFMVSFNEWAFVAPLSLLSGLGHGITVSATSWWLKSCGISYTTIGIFSICNFMFGWRVFWMPFFEQIDLRAILNFFGLNITTPIQRKGFIVITVLLTSIAMFIASFANPKLSVMGLAIPIAISSFGLATADSIMVAYIRETIQPDSMGISTAAYRIGFFIASAAALFFHETLGIQWGYIFRFIGILIALLMCTIFFAPTEKNAQVKTWHEAFVMPYKNIVKTYGKYLIVIVVFMVLYKSQERFTAPMEQQFLRYESGLGSAGFFILKLISTFALAFSAVKSGPLIQKFGYKGTFYAAILSNACVILCFFLHTLKTKIAYGSCVLITLCLFLLFTYITAKRGKAKYILGTISLTIVALINFEWTLTNMQLISVYSIVILTKMISGIRSSLLYTYQNGLASKRYALTQIALMSSIERLAGGDAIQTASGWVVDNYGWSIFFIISLLMSLTPIVLINKTKYPSINSHKSDVE